MKSSIEAKVEFYFKGKCISPSATVDLDGLMEKNGGIPPLHTVLAMASDMDSYSYEYEMFLTEDIEFTNPTGLAAECMVDGLFDRELFMARWKEEKELSVLNEVAKTHLGIVDLSQHAETRAALIAAYQAGKAQQA